jgi:reactive intermediate/imine deaminase
MKIIKNKSIPEPKGHYSPCVEHNGTLYISGQLPRSSITGKIPEGILAQTETVFENLFQLLEAAGSAKDQLISVRIYLPDIQLWDEVNKIYARILGNHKPARCVVPTRDLHYNCLIEVEAIAAIK